MCAMLHGGKIVNGRTIIQGQQEMHTRFIHGHLTLSMKDAMELELTSEHGRTEIGMRERRSSSYSHVSKRELTILW